MLSATKQPPLTVPLLSRDPESARDCEYFVKRFAKCHGIETWFVTKKADLLAGNKSAVAIQNTPIKSNPGRYLADQKLDDEEKFDKTKYNQAIWIIQEMVGTKSEVHKEFRDSDDDCLATLWAAIRDFHQKQPVVEFRNKLQLLGRDNQSSNETFGTFASRVSTHVATLKQALPANTTVDQVFQLIEYAFLTGGAAEHLATTLAILDEKQTDPTSVEPETAIRSFRLAEERREVTKGSSFVQQRELAGGKPKTARCLNFCKGSCPRGDQCRFSHNQADKARYSKGCVDCQNSKLPPGEKVKAVISHATGAKECPSKSSKAKKDDVDDESDPANRNLFAGVDEENVEGFNFFNFMMRAKGEGNLVRVLDSGTTFGCTSTTDLRDTRPHKATIGTGGGSVTARVTGTATVRGPHGPFDLEDQLGIDNFPVHTIPVSGFDLKGGSTVFQNGKGVVYDRQVIIPGNANVILEAHLDTHGDKLYKIPNERSRYVNLLSQCSQVGGKSHVGGLNKATLIHNRTEASYDLIQRLTGERGGAVCKICPRAKAHQLPISKLPKAPEKEVGDKVYADLAGDKRSVYFMDSCSAHVFRHPFPENQEATAEECARGLSRYFTLIRAKAKTNGIKALLTDPDALFTAKTFKEKCEALLVHHETTPRDRHERNRVERFMRIVGEKTRAFMLRSNAPERYRGLAQQYATFVYNSIPTQGISRKGEFHCPEARFVGKPITDCVSRLRTFGTECWALEKGKSKDEDKTTHGIFVGVNPLSPKSYEVVSISTGRLINSMDVFFDETSWPFATGQEPTATSLKRELQHFNVFVKKPPPNLPLRMKNAGDAETKEIVLERDDDDGPHLPEVSPESATLVKGAGKLPSLQEEPTSPPATRKQEEKHDTPRKGTDWHAPLSSPGNPQPQASIQPTVLRFEPPTPQIVPNPAFPTPANPDAPRVLRARRPVREPLLFDKNNPQQIQEQEALLARYKTKHNANSTNGANLFSFQDNEKAQQLGLQLWGGINEQEIAEYQSFATAMGEHEEDIWSGVNFLIQNGGVSREPRFAGVATNSTNGPVWIPSMDKEITGLNNKDAFITVARDDVIAAGHKVFPSTWAFRDKSIQQDSPVDPKSRFCVNGARMRQGIEFDQKFTPCARATSERLLFHIMGKYGLLGKVNDFSQAYTNSRVEKIFYIEQAYGYETEEMGVKPPNKFVHRTTDERKKLRRKVVLAVHVALYGAPQSGRFWYDDLVKALKEFGFIQNRADNCLLTFSKGPQFMITCLHVDDQLTATTSGEFYQEMLTFFREAKRWPVKDLGDVERYLGMRVTRDYNLGVVSLDQEEYIDSSLVALNLLQLRNYSTPMAENPVLLKDDGSAEVDQTSYRRLLGAGIYPAVLTRPDVMLPLNTLARFSQAPSQKHQAALERVWGYLKFTKSQKLVLGGATNNPFCLQGSTDADHAMDPNTYQSVTAYVFRANNALISWRTYLQKTVATSSTHAEYQALSEGVREGLWLYYLVRDMFAPIGIELPTPIALHQDNTGAIALAENPVHHARNKHMNVQMFFVRQVIRDGLFLLFYCKTKDQLADFLTKPLGRKRFQYLRDVLMLQNPIATIAASEV